MTHKPNHKKDEKTELTPADKKRIKERNEKRKEKKQEKKEAKEIAKLKEICEAEKKTLQQYKDALKDQKTKQELWYKYIGYSNGEKGSLSWFKANANKAGKIYLNNPNAAAWWWVTPQWVEKKYGGTNQYVVDRVFTAMDLGTNALTNYSQYGPNPILTNPDRLNSWYQTALDKITSLDKSIENWKKKIEEQEKIQKAACKAYRDALNGEETDDGGGGGGGDDTPAIKPITDKQARQLKYKYNLPMVKSAYYQKGLNHLQMSLVDKPNWTVKDNGRKMWNGKGGGKGVIQADAQYANEWKNKEWRDFYGEKVKRQQLYGMRFLYNPMTVSMGWGVVMAVDPNIQSLGLDKSVALSPALLQSTISFSMYLNRIEDMNHIDENGWRRPEGSDVNPWPTKELPSAFNDDLKEIYNRGTMYDLEYLFSALYPANPRHWSNLNGYTSDWGWLTGYACEVHLGDGLRYKARISSLDVNHIMFNERMVPVLSEVNITMNRYPDVRQDKKYKKGVDKAKKKRAKEEKQNTDDTEKGGKK